MDKQYDYSLPFVLGMQAHLAEVNIVRAYYEEQEDKASLRKAQQLLGKIQEVRLECSKGLCSTNWKPQR